MIIKIVTLLRFCVLYHVRFIICLFIKIHFAKQLNKHTSEYVLLSTFRAIYLMIDINQSPTLPITFINQDFF